MLARMTLCGQIFCLIGLAGMPGIVAAEPLANACTTAAEHFLDDLSAAQRTLATSAFAGEPRRTWAYFPNVAQLAVRNEGVKLADMSASQRVAAHRLIECGLSSQGYQKAAGIIRLDDILGQTDLYRELSNSENPPVGSQNYWLAVFGEPGAELWGWQLEGHHLGLNFTVIDGEIVYAPAFMGADPLEVPDGSYAGWRLLGHEIDKALRLVTTLSGEQRDKAILDSEIPERLFTRPGREEALKKFIGIRASELSATQQGLLRSLINEYVGNSAEPIAARHLKAIMQDLPDNTWFAWMGPTRTDAGYYYRVHSPSLLIEFVTARDRQVKERPPNPNHVHSMFSYPGNNFGDDLLAKHYAASPEHQHE